MWPGANESGMLSLIDRKEDATGQIGRASAKRGCTVGLIKSHNDEWMVDSGSVRRWG